MEDAFAASGGLQPADGALCALEEDPFRVAYLYLRGGDDWDNTGLGHEEEGNDGDEAKKLKDNEVIMEDRVLKKLTLIACKRSNRKRRRIHLIQIQMLICLLKEQMNARLEM